MSTSPWFIISYTESAVAVCNAICTIGYFSLYILQISANVSTAANSPHPIEIVPSINSSLALISSIIFSSKSIISKALRFNSIPASVSVILRFPLIKSDVPSSSSNAESCLESVGCVIFSCSAAFVKFCSFATVKKYRNSLISIYTPSFINS